MEQKLGDFVDRKAERASLPELFALHRAFLTVVIEKMDMVDDSCGVIGQPSSSLFEEYVKLDRSALAMSPTDFFLDLIEWLIWEDYGFTHDEQPAFFAGLESDEVPLVEQILRTQWDEVLQILVRDETLAPRIRQVAETYFQHESASEFKDWATDLPVAYAEIALEKWREGKPTRSAIHAMQDFIEENFLHWANGLKRSLTKTK